MRYYTSNKQNLINLKKCMKKLIVFLLVTTLFAASKKDSNANQANPATDPNRIVGTWAGKYSTSDNIAPDYNCCYEIKANGVLVVHDITALPNAPTDFQGSGTWKLEGSIFKGTFQCNNGGVKRSVLASIFNGDKTIKGFRGEDNAVTGKGQLELNKL
jgi:hypothetical protein